MEHAEVRELLEDAAIEPGGLERLMAGDTSTAALVAGHLAACPECTDELERLRRSARVIRQTVRELPPPELRDRTLAFIAAVGRPRRQPGPAVQIPSPPLSQPEPLAVRQTADRRRRVGWVAVIAAALVVVMAGTALVVGGVRDGVINEQATEIAALSKVNHWTMRIHAQADAKRVQLASTMGGPTAGTLIFSPSSGELVVVADALTPPPSGHEYRCWVEIGGKRAAIGKMYFGGDLAYWVGAVPVGGLGPGATFGVSLVDLGGTDGAVQPVLVGEL